MAKVMLVTFVCFFRRTGRSYLSHSLSAFNGASDLCVCVCVTVCNCNGAFNCVDAVCVLSFA